MVLTLFKNSAGILLLSLAVAGLLGVLMGTTAAQMRGKGARPVMILASILGVSTPSFLLAMLFWVANVYMYRLIGAKTALLPPTGFGWDAHMVMPCLVLSMRPFAQVMQIAYISTLEVLKEDFIQVARARGAPRRLIIFRHVFRNILIPILTTLGTSLRFSLASLPVVESFFLWPGLGQGLLQAIALGMQTLVTDLVVCLGAMFLLINLGLEVLYPWIDPRLRKDAETVNEQEDERFSWKENWLRLWNWLKNLQLPGSRRAGNPLHARKQTVQTAGSALMIEGKEVPYASDRKHILRSFYTNAPLVAGTLMVLALVVLAAWGGHFTSASPYETHSVMKVDGVIQGPPFGSSSMFPWGTDVVGRDIQALVLNGARQTLALAVFATIARVLLGLILGMVAGWWQNRWIDRFIQGLIAVWAAFPVTIFAMILILGIGIQKGMSVFVIALCAVGWGETAQYIRGQVITQKPQLYIEAARSVGASPREILFKHILPHLVSSAVVFSVMEMGGVLMLLAELGFLNIFMGGGYKAEISEIGRQSVFFIYSDVPEWGAMLSNIRDWWRSYPWMAWYPGIFFFFSILAFNLWGEGLRRFIEESRINLSRLINRYTVLVAAALLVGAVFAIRSNTPVQKYSSQANLFDTGKAMEEIKVLSSPEMKGRESGTGNEKAAAEYIASQMKEIGLLPAGENRTFLQPFKNTQFHLEGMPQLDILDSSGNKVAGQPVYREDFVEYLGTDPDVGESSGVVVGVAINSGIRTADVPALIVRDYELTDKILLVRAADYPSMKFVSVAGLLIVNDTPEMPEKKFLFPKSSSLMEQGKRPTMLITPAMADQILAMAGSSLAEMNRQASTLPLDKFYKTAPGGSIHMNIPGTLENLEETHTNIIGYIPGSGAAMGEGKGGGLDSQVIVVSAYYDGVGVGPDGTVYPGANDNASGTAAMLEIARALKQGDYAPWKTIVFIAWTAGERGVGLGVEDVLNATGTLGMLTTEAVIEMSGVGSGTGDAVLLDSGSSYRLLKIFEQSAEKIGTSITTRGRGPHFGNETRAGFGGRSALSAYLSWDGSDALAHTPADTFESIDAKKLEKIGKTATLVVTILSRETEY